MRGGDLTFYRPDQNGGRGIGGILKMLKRQAMPFLPRIKRAAKRKLQDVIQQGRRKVSRMMRGGALGKKRRRSLRNLSFRQRGGALKRRRRHGPARRKQRRRRHRDIFG